MTKIMEMKAILSRDTMMKDSRMLLPKIKGMVGG
jgi:hypothetical protein